MHSYYIDTNGSKDGPHDLVTVMRRIRSQKITGDTLIYIDESETAMPAKQVEALAFFFQHGENAAAPRKSRGLSLTGSLVFGWYFMLENNIMSMFAGWLLLISVAIMMVLGGIIGLVPAGMLAWCVFMMMYPAYLLIILRQSRGQSLGVDFIQRHIIPLLSLLVLSGLVLALMIAGGLVLLIVPGIMVMTVYAFVPLIIFDHGYSLIEAMEASRLLLTKNRGANLLPVAGLMFLHLICLLLIIPTLITLPIFSAALCKFYDELLAA